MKKFYFLFFVPLFLVGCSDKEDVDNKIQQAEWTIYDTDNSGIPHNYANCIAIDNNNNKWIGTRGGYNYEHGSLCMFDGTN